MLSSVSKLRCDAPEDEKLHLIGCHRVVSPAETVDRIRPLMPRMGITRTADVTGLDRIGVPVVMVTRPNAKSLAVSQGKGLDLMAATASGLMESVELFHAEHIELPLKLGSHRQLSQSHAMVDIDHLAHVHPQKFHDNLGMLWIEGMDLFSGEPRWVPYETVRADFTFPAPPGSGCFDCSSNGLASGNSLIEAMCHGICEVIERDATALWNQSSNEAKSRTGLALDSVTDEFCLGVMQQLRDAEFDIAVWETTSDIAVASFFVLISDRQNPNNHRGIGAGTHPARNIALLRALTEAVQVRTTYISGARDDLSEREYSHDHRNRAAQETKRLLEAHLPERKFPHVPDHSSTTFSGDLDWLLAQLRKVGVVEAVMVNLSKPEFEVPVVKMIIPGLEGPDDHADYLPGQRATKRSGVKA